MIGELCEECLFRENCGSFFGGKDPLYAIHLIEKQGVIVVCLLSLIPSLLGPSPHVENLEDLKRLAESMGKSLTIVDFQREDEFIDVLKRLEVMLW